MPIGSIDPDFIDTTHTAVHSFPFPSTAEFRRWCLGYSFQDSGHGRSNFCRAILQKFTSRDLPFRIILDVPLEKMNEPWTRPTDLLRTLCWFLPCHR